MIKSSLIAIPAVAALAVAAPAMAAPPYTVTVGGSTSGTHDVTAATTAPIDFIVAGPAGPVPMSCDASSAAAEVTAGVDSDGQDVGVINNTTWTGCEGPFGIQLTVVHNGTWSLNLTDSSVTAGATEPVVEGNIGDIDAHIFDSSMSGLCDFTVKGVADGHVDEVDQDLEVSEDGTDGSLYIDSIAPGGDCLGAIAVGNPAEFYGIYDGIDTPSGTVEVGP